MKHLLHLLLSSSLILISCFQTNAQNPIIGNQFTADPSARVFGDSVFLYPSHDIVAVPGKGRPGWFCMEDYHVFSSANLTDWIDHGVIVSQNKVPWIRPDSYNMWAPDCIERNNKYYFYFPSSPNDTITYGKGFTVGVAVADKPTGPFIPEATPVKGVRGIDPNVFIDSDGQAYLYWSAGNIYAAKLKDNMLELASDPVILAELPAKGLKEGPYLFERNGIYYLTYPHVENKTERLEYATGNNPLGPFKVTGIIMDESPTGCWTNHHSVIQFKNQWYLFYHHNDYSPKFDKARSVRADSLLFHADGTIQKVIPTLRGIGLTQATKEIQIDRYSAISDQGAAVRFIDTIDTFKGWKTVFAENNAWIQFNSIDFGKKPLKNGSLRIKSATSGTLQFRTDNPNGQVLAEVKIPAGDNWHIINFPLSGFKAGIHNLVVLLKDGSGVETDWVRFK